MSGISLPNNATAGNFDAVGKVDNMSLPPAATGSGGWDVSWTNLGPALANIPGLGLTAPRFLISLTLAASSGALVVNGWRAVWQNATATAPVVARTSAGIVTITVPTVVSSEWDSGQNPPVYNNYPVSFIGASATWNSVPSSSYIVAVLVSTNVITLKTQNGSGTPTDFSGSTMFIQAF